MEQPSDCIARLRENENTVLTRPGISSEPIYYPKYSSRGRFLGESADPNWIPGAHPGWGDHHKDCKLLNGDGSGCNCYLIVETEKLVQSRKRRPTARLEGPGRGKKRSTLSYTGDTDQQEETMSPTGIQGQVAPEATATNVPSASPIVHVVAQPTNLAAPQHTQAIRAAADSNHQGDIRGEDAQFKKTRDELSISKQLILFKSREKKLVEEMIAKALRDPDMLNKKRVTIMEEICDLCARIRQLELHEAWLKFKTNRDRKRE